MVKDQRTDYKRAFNEKNYARLNITIPIAQKQAVEAHAASKGKSVNGLVNDLLREYMGLTDAQWKSKPTQPIELPDLDPLGDLEGNNETGVE